MQAGSMSVPVKPQRKEKQDHYEEMGRERKEGGALYAGRTATEEGHHQIEYE